MKSITAILASLFITTQSHALTINGVEPTATPAATPVPISLGSLVDGLHLLDNATPTSFRDVIHGQWLGGAATAVYKEYYTSLDAAYAVPIGESGFYAPALRVYLGQLLMEQVPLIKKATLNNIVLTSALSYLTLGGWYAHDFDKGINRAGYNMGVQIKFGS